MALVNDNVNEIVDLRKWCLSQTLDHVPSSHYDVDHYSTAIVQLATVLEAWVLRDVPDGPK